MADTIDLLSLKSRHGVDRDANVAILSGRKAHLHKSPSATADSFVDLPAKTAVPDLRAVVSNNLSVELSRTIAANLLLEIEGGRGPNPQPIAALAEVVRLSTFNDVLGDLPMIGIDSFNLTGPTKGLQAADVETHESFGVLALPLKAVADTLQVPARPVEQSTRKAFLANAFRRDFNRPLTICFEDLHLRGTRLRARETGGLSMVPGGKILRPSA